jgi:hypothetical protein
MEMMMTFIRSLLIAVGGAAALGLAGCGAMYGHGHGHGQGMHGGGMGAGACPMGADMQQKMAAAKTPEERQALMAEHQKSMGAGAGQCAMMQTPAK